MVSKPKQPEIPPAILPATQPTVQGSAQNSGSSSVASGGSIVAPASLITSGSSTGLTRKANTQRATLLGGGAR